MFNIMKNEFKILLRKPSLLLSLIVIPTILTLGFSYMLGSEIKYSIGVVNNDNGIITDKIIENIENANTFSLKSLKESELDTAIVGKEIELAIIFEEDFSNNILNGKSDSVKIKSVGESEVKATLTSLISSETSTLNTLGIMANGDTNKFYDLLDDYNDNSIKYELSTVKPQRISVYASVGIQIMMIMMTGFFITRFVIDDEVSGTKSRILLGNVSKTSYYMGTLLTFYICSAISSISYFIVCNVLGFDFVTDKPWLFLLVLFSINFFAIGFNLFLITISKTPQVASNLSSIFVVSSSMLCGLFWPFSIMPESIQSIGNMIPLRWAGIAFEKIQQGGSLNDIYIYLLGILLAGLTCLFITVIFSKQRK